MKNCKDIENNLPLYLDNSLSGADKQTVEEHLKSCPLCTKALIQLRKTQSLVNNLAEIEPPAWFKQKIIAKVREEAEKKSLVQKWFYPLRIKIPVQILATVFIAVLAVYIYRAGEEQMKEVVPSSAPAPVMEVSKNQLSEQSREAPETLKANVTKEKVAARKDAHDEKAVTYDMSSGFAAPKTEELKKGRSQENVRLGELDAVKSIKENVVSDIKADKYASAPAKSVELSGAELNKEEKGNILGAAKKAKKAQYAQSLIQRPNILLKVADINITAEEVEKLLIKYEAKNINRQETQVKATLSARIKNQKIKDLTASLKTIGQIEEYIMSDEADAEGNIPLVIEIVNN